MNSKKDGRSHIDCAFSRTKTVGKKEMSLESSNPRFFNIEVLGRQVPVRVVSPAKNGEVISLGLELRPDGQSIFTTIELSIPSDENKGAPDDIKWPSVGALILAALVQGDAELFDQWFEADTQKVTQHTTAMIRRYQTY